ncbi:hypothetical protein EV207_1571 [Scopulibacillus darangshiensis]|uniref:Uncharacterized protein n=1 Tax=Scopulibacillus darangshiensis TaxID=442528 RepID=A0A4R2NF93_9BACL|nr:hypothetical protein EV207_1571 [Scopulibacillus darangshiensis]
MWSRQYPIHKKITLNKYNPELFIHAMENEI